MLLSALRTAGNFVLDLVFPVLCFECGQEGSYLCRKCSFRLVMLTKAQVCAVCADPSPLGQTHSACHNSTLDGFTHALRYKESVVRRLVESLKYQGVSDIGSLAGQLVLQEILNQGLLKYFSDFVMVPMPLHPKRLRWRGYNQAELIAREAAKLLKIPCRPDLLIKTKHSKAQATLNKKQRQENLTGAFTAPNSAAGLKIILVDDVATTRSTLSEAARTLKKARAQTVWALTLAYED